MKQLILSVYIRIFLAVAMKPENRGYLVQQGGAKVINLTK